ncbi:MAG: SDR family oxidoreductase [Stagnimonas sp.]|nr:SDR family oxidoreductase [Stagnimonas sp.]
MSKNSWTTAQLPSLQGRRALVTGAASGIGYETAAAMAAKGAEVILADRNEPGGAAAVQRIRAQSPSAELRFLPLDLGELAGIRRFAEPLLDDGRPLDLLVNVAGILPPVQRATTRDGFELKFGINVLGHFALTGLLLPLLLKATAARVVNVSSLVQAYGRIDFDDLHAERGYEPQRAYSQAKLACLMLALELHERAQAAGSALGSLAAHPGVARTALGSDRKQQTQHRLRDRLEERVQALVFRFLGQSPAEGALPLLYAAATPQARSGGYYGPDGFGQFAGAPVAVRPSKAALDAASRRRLWELCEQQTGVRYSWTG